MTGTTSHSVSAPHQSWRQRSSYPPIREGGRLRLSQPTRPHISEEENKGGVEGDVEAGAGAEYSRAQSKICYNFCVCLRQPEGSM